MWGRLSSLPIAYWIRTVQEPAVRHRAGWKACSTYKNKEDFKMIRNAFKMKLKPGMVEEYKKRHDEIWPELLKELTDAGISDYSIYFDEESLTLFAFQKLSDDNTADNLPNTDVVKKWWSYMADLMETHPDSSPVVDPLREVFHMD